MNESIDPHSAVSIAAQPNINNKFFNFDPRVEFNSNGVPSHANIHVIFNF